MLFHSCFFLIFFIPESTSNDEIQARSDESSTSEDEESGVQMSNNVFETIVVDNERAIRAKFVTEENLQYDNGNTDNPDDVSAEINLVGSSNCETLEEEEEEDETNFVFQTSTLRLPGMPADFLAALVSAMHTFASPFVIFFRLLSNVTQLLVLLWFTTFNPTYRSGNAICGLLHILFSFFGLWFPRTIDQVIALTTFAAKIKNIRYLIMCPQCSTPYEEDRCSMVDPKDPTKRISRRCKTILFPHAPRKSYCDAVLLQTVRTSAGKYTLRPLPSQKLIYPGTKRPRYV
jgi:hypothetical protein